MVETIFTIAVILIAVGLLVAVPVFTIEIPVGVATTLINVCKSACYLLPIKLLMPIIIASFSYHTFRFLWAIFLRVKSFLPTRRGNIMGILDIFSIILKIILFSICVFFTIEFISFLSWFIYYRFIKKMEFPLNISEYEPTSFFKKIVWEFPKQFWLDRINSKSGEFKEYGLHLFCGEQGSGKTTGVVDLLYNRWSKMYPKMKIYTNMGYKYEDGEINHWKDLLNEQRNNGVYGVANVIDEIQTWFSSLQSKDFPPEMITEISQQRKQRKVIVGTAQVFGRVAKPIREQTSFVYLPFTVAGCLTVIRVSKPIYYDEQTFTFKKYIRTYFFVHTPQLRSAFDTYKRIQNYEKIGFKSDLERNTLNN